MRLRLSVSFLILITSFEVFFDSENFLAGPDVVVIRNRWVLPCLLIFSGSVHSWQLVAYDDKPRRVNELIGREQ